MCVELFKSWFVEGCFGFGGGFFLLCFLFLVILFCFVFSFSPLLLPPPALTRKTSENVGEDTKWRGKKVLLDLGF